MSQPLTQQEINTLLTDATLRRDRMPDPFYQRDPDDTAARFPEMENDTMVMTPLNAELACHSNRGWNYNPFEEERWPLPRHEVAVSLWQR